LILACLLNGCFRDFWRHGDLATKLLRVMGISKARGRFGWRAWHHHVTTVMLAMQFIAQQRIANQPELARLTPRDLVEMLKETLPRKPEGKQALVERVNQRHQRRREAIESRFRAQRKEAPS
jgi:hypothetical protein